MKSHRTDFSNLTQLKQSKRSESKVFNVHISFEQQQYETCLKLKTRSISVDKCSLLFTVTYSLAYLECAKGGARGFG